MSGIDKLEITLKDDPSKSNLAGYPIKEFTQRGRDLGFLDSWTYRDFSSTRLLCLQPLETSGPRRGEILVIPRFWRDYGLEGSKSIQHVEKIITNPRHFESMEVLIGTLLALDSQDMVIQSCPITRIDFAADVIQRDVDIPLLFDIDSKRLSECYFEADSGRPETVYWGGKQDMLCIYNRNALMEKIGRDDLISSSHVMRAEHRYNRPKPLAKNLLEQNMMFLEDLRCVGSKIIDGSISPLNSVRAGCLEHTAIENMCKHEARSLGGFEESARMGGYALARRAYRDNPIMKMVKFIPYPTTEQPAHILQDAMRMYMGE